MSNNEEKTAGPRPDLFVSTLNMLRYGAAGEEASEKLTEVLDRVRLTGKAGKLTLELTIRPQQASGQYYIDDVVKTKLPPLAKESTLLFGTPEGNFQRDDPRQPKLDLREVAVKQARVAELPDAAPRVVVG